jgi:uncharacterized protein YecT (DUF1311 family)
MRLFKNIHMRKKFLPLFFILSINMSYGQTLELIKKLEIEHQNCLDKQAWMLGCSIKYNKQMDSLLNVVYNKKRQLLNKEEKLKLKEEQLAWLKKRDANTKKVSTKIRTETDIIGADLEMIITDEEANFVKKRVIYLIKNL